MNRSELMEWMSRYEIAISKEKRLTNATLFSLENCPFSNGAHKDGAFIILNDNGNVAAKCHHASCAGASFSKLYKLKTGENWKGGKKKAKEEKESLFDILHRYIEDGKLELFQDTLGNIMARIISIDEKCMQTMPVRSFEFRINLQNIIYKECGFVLDKKNFDMHVDFLCMQAYQNGKKVKLFKRIANLGDKIIYELDKDTNKYVVLTKEGIQVNNEEQVYFSHSKYFMNQCMPNFDNRVEKGELVRLIKKHFNMPDNNCAILFTIYLVSCFLGTGINHPILSVTGPKGSGKSSVIKRFCQLVDPKYIELGNIPKKEDDICLKISESLVSEFDNLSYIKQDISDLFCRCVTGGVNTRRTLYENTDQTVFDLKSIIVVDGVQVVIKESDLLDRTVFITLERFRPNELKTEAELEVEFEKDKPRILGLCFLTLQKAMTDEEPIDRSATIRMADFYNWGVRIGRALGYKDETIIRIFNKNRQLVNYQSLMEDATGLTILNYMEYKMEVSHTMADLLKILKKLADEIQVDKNLLPKQANALSRKLNKIKSNLEEEGITYNIKNQGYAKVITIKNSKPRHVPIDMSSK